MGVFDGLLERDRSILFEQVFGSNTAHPRSVICHSALRLHILVVDDNAVVIDNRNPEKLVNDAFSYLASASVFLSTWTISQSMPTTGVSPLNAPASGLNI